MEGRKEEGELRTVVVGPNWVGDTVMALPVLAGLAESGRRVTVLARSHLHPLLALVPAVHDTVEKAASDGATVAALREGEFDEAVVLPNSFRSAWLAYRAGIPVRWGYGGGFRRPWLRPGLPAPSRRGRPQVEDYRELLAAMKVQPPADWVPRLVLGEADLRRGDELLGRAGIERGQRPVVGLFPGAEFGPSKRWPWARFAELARALRKARPTLRQAILAGPKEVWIAVRTYEESAKMHPVVGPDLDLADLARVVSRLGLLVTNDSGPMHLAAALGVPCLALFGPTDPGRTAPAGDGHRVLASGRWCSPCFRKRCPLLHHGCMKDHAAAEVAEIGLEMLGEG